MFDGAPYQCGYLVWRVSQQVSVEVASCWFPFVLLDCRYSRRHCVATIVADAGSYVATFDITQG